MQDSTNQVNVATLAGPNPVAIQDKDVILISKALNKSQAIFDLLASRRLEVFCLSDVNDSCDSILD